MAGKPKTAGQTVPIRCSPGELEMIDALAARFGAGSRAHVIRLGLDELGRKGGSNRRDLIAGAIDNLTAALALDDATRTQATAADGPACQWDGGGGACDAPAEFSVRTRSGVLHLCKTCAAAKRFDRSIKRPMAVPGA